MKITSIKATGIKGGDFNHTLTGLDIIVGPNFAGKTARLDAVRLALAGYVPELGRNGTMGLARNGQMSVEAEADDGRRVSRTWRKGKTAQHDAGFEAPVVLIDPQTYFGLGDKDRVRYVFGLCRAEEHLNADRILAELKQIRCEEHAEEHERHVRELVDQVDGSDREREDAGQQIQDWLAQLIEHQRADLKLAKQQADTMQKTVNGLIGMAADEEPAADCAAELETARTKLAEAQASRMQAANRVVERACLSQEVNTLRVTIQRSEQASADVAELERQIAELEADKGLDIPEELTEAIARLTAKVQELEAATVELPDLAKLRAAKSTANKKLLSALSRHNQLVDEQKGVKAKLDEVQSWECCPTCQTKTKGWRKRVEESHAKALAEIEQALGPAEAALDGAEQADRAAEKALNAGQEAHDTELRRLRELAEAKGRLETAKSRAESIPAKRQAALAERRGTLTVARGMVAEAERAKERLGQAEQQLAAVPAVDGEALDREIEVARGEVRGLEGRQKLAERQRAGEARRAQAQIDLAAATARVDVLKAAVKVLESLQSELVERVFGGLLATANQLVGGILRHDLEYRDGEIGWFEGGTWVSHRTFSGTEKALAYAALSVALAAGSPIRLVMIDELGRLDAATLKRFLDRVFALVEQGHLDQFIGVATALPGDTSDGFNVIQL